MASLEWNGDRILARTAAAAAAGIDQTMSECVRGARREHEYENQDGFLEASTDIIAPAHPAGDRVAGRWGSTASYALFVEIGTSRIGPDATIREAEGDGNMWSIPGTQPAEGVTVIQPFTVLPPGTMDGQEEWVTLHQPSRGEGAFMEARPFLRPQADANYPTLARRIGAFFRAS
jgi:hypothetical protein